MDYSELIARLLQVGQGMGLNIRFKPLQAYDGRIKGNRVAIREGMPDEYTAFIIAHEIMHAAIHKGNVMGDAEAEWQANRAANVLIKAMLTK